MIDAHRRHKAQERPGANLETGGCRWRTDARRFANVDFNSHHSALKKRQFMGYNLLGDNDTVNLPAVLPSGVSRMTESRGGKWKSSL